MRTYVHTRTHTHTHTRTHTRLQPAALTHILQGHTHGHVPFTHTGSYDAQSTGHACGVCMFCVCTQTLQGAGATGLAGQLRQALGLRSTPSANSNMNGQQAASKGPSNSITNQQLGDSNFGKWYNMHARVVALLCVHSHATQPQVPCTCGWLCTWLVVWRVLRVPSIKHYIL